MVELKKKEPDCYLQHRALLNEVQRGEPYRAYSEALDKTYNKIHRWELNVKVFLESNVNCSGSFAMGSFRDEIPIVEGNK